MKLHVIIATFLSLIAAASALCAMAASPDDAKGDLPRLPSSVRVGSIKTIPGQGGAFGVEIGGFLDNAPFELRGQLGPLAHALNPKADWTLHLALEIAEASVVVKGSVKDVSGFNGLDLEIDAGGENIAALLEAFGVESPVKGPFAAKGNVTDPAPGIYRFGDLRLQWDGSDLKGSCTVDVSPTRTRPGISAAFFSSKLDLRGLWGPEPLTDRPGMENSSKAKAGSTPDGKVFSSEPFDLAFLNALDFQFELLAEKAFFPKSAFTNLHLQAALKDGSLSMNPLTADIGGGKLNGNVQLDASDGNPSFSAFLSVRRMDLSRMLKETELDVRGEGSVDFDLDLNSAGMSLAQVMAGLDGNVSLVMGKGKIDRDYLRYLGFFRINLISTVVNIVSIPGGFRGKEDVSDINCFAMRFDASGGMADLTALVLDSPRMCLVGSGRIDLATEKLDIYIKSLPKEGIGAEGLAKVNLSLSELTRPLSLGGTLASPRVSVDTTRTFLTLGKAIGGAVLFGPAGVAVALFSGKLGSSPENPCLDAIEAAKKGVEIPAEEAGAMRFIQRFLKELNPIH